MRRWRSHLLHHEHIRMHPIARRLGVFGSRQTGKGMAKLLRAKALVLGDKMGTRERQWANN